MGRPKIDPVVWRPPKAPARARAKTGPVPMPPLRILEINGTGPEDVVVDAEGRVITGVDDGRILRVSADGSTIETIADTGGRPLGIEWYSDGHLLICDAHRGLLRVDTGSGDIDVLVTEAAGKPLTLCNNAAVGSDGTVYFTDSSLRFSLQHYRADLLEHSGTGRFLRWTPSGDVEVLLDGLQFANGVALAADESYVVVAETGAYRLTKLWLTGERAGHREILIDNLPGFPDNLSAGSGTTLWLALPTPRNAQLDLLLPLPPVLRKLTWALPDRAQPQPERTVWVLGLDGTDGRIVHDLQGSSETFSQVTGVREHDGRLYLGSLWERAVATLELPA